jgi:signal transduction histidine kinase/CHASE1-domain containing sensor protein/ActR/RegA family two-component response regulator
MLKGLSLPRRWLANLSYHQIIPLGLGLGMALSLALFLSIVRQEYSYAVANFYLDAHMAANAVQQTLTRGEQDFTTTRSLYMASLSVTRQEFAEFVNDQQASNPLPGLIALEWIPYVPAAQRAQFEQLAQADGWENFQFTERDEAGTLVKAGERNVYYPVYYVAPQDGLEHILGFDLGSDPTRLATMEQARDTGLAAVTGPVTLIQSPTGAKGALIFTPIYDSSVAYATVAERRAHVRGFLLGIFELPTLLAAGQTLQPAEDSYNAAYDLYLLDAALPPGQQLLFFNPAHPATTPVAATTTSSPTADLNQLRAGIYYEQAIVVGDQKWQLIIKPGFGQLESDLSPLPLVAMLGVLAFSALATAYIARRRQVQEILQKTEEQYRLVVDSVADVMWAAEAATMQLYFVTPSIQALTGFSPEQVLQKRYIELFAPESAALVESAMPDRLAALTAGNPQTRRLRVYGVTRDITERRRTERTQMAQFAVSRILAQSPQLGDAILQILEALTLRLNWLGAEFWQRSTDGSRLEWCAGWCRPGYPLVAEFLQQSKAYSFALGQGLVGRAWQNNQAYWEADLDERPEYPRHQIGQAAGLKSAVSVPLWIEDEALGVMVFYDVSTRLVDDWLLATLADLGRQIGQFIARKQAEVELHQERASLAERVQERTADLSRANAQLAQALSAKDKFLANMSHELRTPLNGILTLAESLQEGTYGPLNNRQQRSIALVAQSGHHLLSLINDILDLSKVEAGKLDLQMEIVSAYALSQASLALVQEMASKKSIHLAFYCNDSGVELRIDPRRLKQILVNLLGNAIKFTPTGGHVTLAVTTKPEGQAIEFAVQDDGIGIPPAEQTKLFQPFTQLDGSLARHYEGTGLGLALVRRLVELHHGRVSVESTGINGQGSRFVVTLPWEGAMPQSNTAQAGVSGRQLGAGETGAQGDDRQAASAPAAACQARILAVDDNELNLLALEDYLTSAGFQLFFANDGEQALQQAQEIQPDLILMDIQMPKMNGMEATRRLRSDPRFAATPILALTALAMPGDRELCLDAGANAYISKPFLLKELVKTINDWLAHAQQTPVQS